MAVATEGHRPGMRTLHEDVKGGLAGYHLGALPIGGDHGRRHVLAVEVKRGRVKGNGV
jgi:hypothetical protein